MTLLTWYAFVGMPLLLAAMVWGGFKLIDREDRRTEAARGQIAKD